MTLYFICQRLKPATSAAPENEDSTVNPAESPLESLDEVMDEEIYSLEVERTPAKARLDAWLHDQFPEWSRSMIRRWIEAGAIRVDDQTTKPSHSLRVGQK